MKDLIIDSLSKTYPDGTKALSDINLNIKPGMFGLLGPNGAGKSTLMRIVASLQNPDKGSINFGDINVLKEKQRLRQVLGFLPQEFDFYPQIKAFDMLMHFAALNGIRKKSDRKRIVLKLIKLVNLTDSKYKKIGGFSGGMKQRLGIAQALISDPEILIVDEPTAGLDPKERHHFHNILSAIGENRIVILSTHIVDDVKDLCTDMAIINKGRLVLKESPLDSIKKIAGRIWGKVIEKAELREYEEKYNIISNRLYMGKIMVHVYNEENPGNGFEVKDPDLEDVYFNSINKAVNL